FEWRPPRVSLHTLIKSKSLPPKRRPRHHSQQDQPDNDARIRCNGVAKRHCSNTSQNHINLGSCYLHLVPSDTNGLILAPPCTRWPRVLRMSRCKGRPQFRLT